MLGVLALTLVMQAEGTSAILPPTARIDSVVLAKVMKRTRIAEAQLFAQWRFEHRKLRDFKWTDPRYFSLHCHSDEHLPYGHQYHLITTDFSAKSMCPIWFQDAGKRPDESEWIDNGLPEKSREKIKVQRTKVQLLLDSAASLAPNDRWLTGQRVRLAVDQREFERAESIATTECRITSAYCSMLLGYALYSAGNHRGAEIVFDQAVRSMSADDRCVLLNIRIMLERRDHAEYEKLSCAQRAVVDEQFWWLSDPLFMQPGNERLAVHLYRTMIVELHAAAGSDEHFEWRAKYGGNASAEMLLRYGWPTVQVYHQIENENHYGWLKFTDSSFNASREYTRPRYHTTPSLSAARSVETLKGTDLTQLGAPWNESKMAYEREWWPIEHIARPGPLAPLDYQLAQFRRANGPLVALATDARSQSIPEGILPRYTAALVAMTNPRDSGVKSLAPATAKPTGATVMTLEMEPGFHLLSAEIVNVDRDSAPASRARFAFFGKPGLDKLPTGAPALSDPVLFAAPDNNSALPREATQAIERMLPSTDLEKPTRVGVFVESYGLFGGDVTEITLTVRSEDTPGFLMRLGTRLGISDGTGGSLAIKWRDDQPGTASASTTISDVVVQSRSIVINLSALKAGKYSLEIAAGRPGTLPAISRREFRIRK